MSEINPTSTLGDKPSKRAFHGETEDQANYSGDLDPEKSVNILDGSNPAARGSKRLKISDEKDYGITDGDAEGLHQVGDDVNTNTTEEDVAIAQADTVFPVDLKGSDVGQDAEAELKGYENVLNDVQLFGNHIGAEPGPSAPAVQQGGDMAMVEQVGDDAGAIAVTATTNESADGDQVDGVQLVDSDSDSDIDFNDEESLQSSTGAPSEQGANNDANNQGGPEWVDISRLPNFAKLTLRSVLARFDVQHADDDVQGDATLPFLSSVQLGATDANGKTEIALNLALGDIRTTVNGKMTWDPTAQKFEVLFNL